ncbi:MAG: hypothetical protein ACHP84_16175 [Caulobacterales bacterium]
MKIGRAAVLTALATVAGQAAGEPSGKQAVSGPVAVYWMSAATSSGIGAGASQGGPGGQEGQQEQRRRPGFGDIMAMEMHPHETSERIQNMGASSLSHTLILQLGSARRPQSGDPTAEHDPPAALGAGPALPLVTPVQQPAHEEAEPGPPAQYHPQGRMLIFWGCGEHAGPGQPLVIDFADMTKGGGQFAELARGLAISPMQPPSPARNATYGEWPNAEGRTTVGPDASLQGAHTIKGNYSPQIDFSLAADQDFLPPFKLTTNAKNPSGSATLAWRPVDGGQGYLATMYGAKGPGETVMWTSSQVQASAFALPDYLSDGEIARLVARQVLMAPSQTSCVVPQEAVQAAGMGSFRLVAYGGEYNISYPPRPPAPQPWNIAWQVKIRYRSSTGGVLGMDMSQMMGGGASQDPRAQEMERRQQQQQQEQDKRRRNPFNPFGGLIP